jgi:hypothetical protein
LNRGPAMGHAAHDVYRLPVHWSPSIAPDRETSLADMLDWIDRQSPASGAEALRHLRAAFPDSPLALRVAALSTLMRRYGGESGGYRPR